MKNRKSWILLLCTLGAIPGAAQYTTTMLPPPAGVPDDVNTAIIPASRAPINNKGQVAAVVRRPGMDMIAAVWTDGQPTVLPIPAGYSLFSLQAINDAGQVIGQVTPTPPIPNDPNASQAIVWNGTSPTLIPHYPAACPSNANAATYISNPLGINRAGHIAGETHKADQCDWGWIWDGSNFIAELTYTGSCPVGSSGVAGVAPFGMNDADHIVTNLAVPNPTTGHCQANSTPALFAPGHSPYLLAVPDGYFLNGSGGNAINNLDQSYGLIAQDNITRAFFWTGSTYINATPGYSFIALNNIGQALLAAAGVPHTLYVWQNGGQTEVPFPVGVASFQSPAGINDAGQIAVYVGTINNASRTALLTPSGACASDVSQEVTVTRGGFRFNHATQHFTQLVTVTNTGSFAIIGPISVVFDNVPNSATLYALSGVTLCNSPAGSGYMTVPSGLPANGGSVSMTLDFIDTASTGITYTTRVLAGSGLR